MEYALLCCDVEVPEPRGNAWLGRGADRLAAGVGLLGMPPHDAFTKTANELANELKGLK